MKRGPPAWPAKAKTMVQDDAALDLDWPLTQLAAYVEMASDGDKAKTESAGSALAPTNT